MTGPAILAAGRGSESAIGNRSEQEHLVNKHLVWLSVIGLSVAGCRTHENDKAVSPVGPLPAGSFSRSWAAKLDLKDDPARQMHLTADRVFVYTRRNISFVLGRSGGQLQFISGGDVSGGVLR